MTFLPARRPAVRRLSAALLAIGTLALSAGVGWWAAESSRVAVGLEATLYVTEESQAELFISDEFGNLLPESSVVHPVRVGVNNVRFDLGGDQAQRSLVQRLDPCVCDSPVLIGDLRLATPLYSSRFSSADWGASGDVAELRAEGSSVLVRTTPATEDPQIILYLDIRQFSSRAWLVAFWAAFGLTASLALLTIGLVAVIREIRKGGANTAAGGSSTRRVLSREPRIPLTAAIVAAVVAVIAGTQQFVGAMVTGLTIDEPNHVRNLERFLETGLYSSSVYGPTTSLLGHVINVALGTEVWGEPSYSADAYEGRHLAVAFIGLVGLLAVGLTAWLAFGSFRWALVASAFLGSIPAWVGHSMFNIKDIPLATGYSFVTTGLIAALSNRLHGWSKWAIVVSTLGSGFFVGAGTRPGSVALLGGSALVAVVVWFVFHRAWRFTAKSMAILLGGFVVALGASAWILFSSGLGSELLSSIDRSVDYPWTGFNLYAGEMVAERPGAAVIAMVFASYLPLLLVALVAAGFLYGLVRIGNIVSSRAQWSIRESAFVLISAQALVGFVTVALFDSVIYDGGRQLLFALPAFALLAVFGLFGTLRAVPYLFPSARVGRRITLALVIGGLSWVTVEQVGIFPYNYSYYNEIAQGPGVTGRWETDYWGSSIREGARFIAPDDPAICGVAGTHNFDIGKSLPAACSLLEPYVGEAAHSAASQLRGNQFWVVRMDRTLLNKGPISSANCELHHEVTRPLRGEEVVMSRVYVCDDL